MIYCRKCEHNEVFGTERLCEKCKGGERCIEDFLSDLRRQRTPKAFPEEARAEAVKYMRERRNLN